MSKWEVDFSVAVAELEAAQAADQCAYDALQDGNKHVWALWPLRNWPEPHRSGQLAIARSTLIQAENAIRDLVQRQSAAIRNARGRRIAVYERRAFAETQPGIARPEAAAMYADMRPMAAPTAASMARNPSED